MKIDQITVIGCGTMGRGIAHVSAAAGFDTVLYDLNQDVLAGAYQAIESTLRRGVEKGKIAESDMAASMSRIHLVTDLEVATRNANLIIEAAPEDLDIKREIFTQADIYCPEDTVFASNTSSLPISTLAGSVERRERFIGMHFFNPPHVMKLLELVMGDRTSDETLEIAQDVARRMKKETIVVKDSPGFATSRLGVAIGLEAIRMLEEGVASAADIDRAMELGYNHPMGPLRLTDLVGLDVRLSIAEHLAATLGPRFEPPRLLRSLVEQGRLGRKTGSGFYDWENE